MTSKTCLECGGSGWLYYPAVEYGDPQPAEWQPCPRCNREALDPPWYEPERSDEGLVQNPETRSDSWREPPF